MRILHFGQLDHLFSDVKNYVLGVWKKSADNGDDDWNYNCDCDDDNIDKIDYKYDQQTYKYYDIWVKID